MEAVAKANYQRISPRKARTVIDMVRGRRVAEAIDELRFTRKVAASVVGKVLDSAVANARHQDENVDLDALVVKTAYVDKAPDRHMRRWRPRAMGRATRIVKGMSHITVVISDEKEA
jgi:large subunit ribosomal protein L22